MEGSMSEEEEVQVREVSLREMILQVLEVLAQSDEKLALQLALAEEKVRRLVLEQKLKDAEQEASSSV
jgi:hypothetical protein